MVLCSRILWTEKPGWEMSQQGVSLVGVLWTLLVVGEQDRTVGVRLKVGVGVGSHCPGCGVAVGRPGGWWQDSCPSFVALGSECRAPGRRGQSAQWASSQNKEKVGAAW